MIFENNNLALHYIKWNRLFFILKKCNTEKLTRVNQDRNIFSINVELTSTFVTLQRFGPSSSQNFKYWDTVLVVYILLQWRLLYISIWFLPGLFNKHGYTIHSTQYTIHNTQYTVHNTQYTIHSTQTIHNTQYTIHISMETKSSCHKNSFSLFTCKLVMWKAC